MENSTDTITTPRTRRADKEPGVIKQVWEQSGRTTINSFGLAENSSGILNESLLIGREALKPTLIDARVETLNAVAEGIRDLVAMGISEDEARAYLTKGIS